MAKEKKKGKKNKKEKKNKKDKKKSGGSVIDIASIPISSEPASSVSSTPSFLKATPTFLKEKAPIIETPIPPLIKEVEVAKSAPVDPKSMIASEMGDFLSDMKKKMLGDDEIGDPAMPIPSPAQVITPSPQPVPAPPATVEEAPSQGMSDAQKAAMAAEMGGFLSDMKKKMRGDDE